MGGNVERIKERLDIAEVLSPYLKLEKSGANYRARCPFHNEKTPSFFVSQVRQSYYCFGCGAKGDMFTFVEEVEGVDFREALKMLAEKAGIELENQSGASGSVEAALKKELLSILDASATFFQDELERRPEALDYLHKRGISDESIKLWRIGYVPDEWRSLYSHLLSLGFSKEHMLKAGLIKYPEGNSQKDPYDVFRGRIMFPLSDASGRIVAFSGRALPSGQKDASEIEPKYLNSPDTVLFTKSELLYGLDKAKEDVRRKNYAILVEGQMDMVLSHQVGVKNTVASSGTAFTSAHLVRLKKISPRVVLAFDGDEAGRKAAEKSAILSLSLGMEVKVADLPVGTDPADTITKDSEVWKDYLRQALPAIEYFLSKLILEESDQRKLAKSVEKRILPLVLLLESSMEKSHFVSLIAKRAGIKEEMVWEDLRRVKAPDIKLSGEKESDAVVEEREVMSKLSRKELIEERLKELAEWRKELSGEVDELEALDKEETELKGHLSKEEMREELTRLTLELARAEALKDQTEVNRLSEDIAKIHKNLEV